LSRQATQAVSTETASTTTFQSLGLHPLLLRAISELGFERPTEIQEIAIPPALAGKDVLASAMTGSGKTAAFLLPTLQRLRERGSRATRALVLTPTRELAAQVADQLRALGRYSGVSGAAIYGGVGMLPQKEAFRRGVEVLIATPGRLLDHLKHDYATLDAVEVLVVDEADRMLDMGFLPDVRRIISRLPMAGRQTLLFSATLPPAIATLAGELMRSPVRIGKTRKATPAPGITQAFYPVSASLKPDLLMALLERQEVGNAIVFCRTKHRANRIAEKLARKGVSVAHIHGNRSQGQRTSALEGFKSGRFRVLVATDIVARGIDVVALGHVINFDVPAAPDDYIHRVGRTARAEAIGEAYTLVSPEEEPLVRDIERALRRSVERRTLSGFDYGASSEALELPISRRFGRTSRSGATRERTAGKPHGFPRNHRRRH
jgi:ATP-dependent RNA helicase RhlE